MRIKTLLLEQFHHRMPNLDSKILKLLICPKTGSKLFYDKKKKILFTKDGKNKYKIENDILNLFVK